MSQKDPTRKIFKPIIRELAGPMDRTWSVAGASAEECGARHPFCRLRCVDERISRLSLTLFFLPVALLVSVNR